MKARFKAELNHFASAEELPPASSYLSRKAVLGVDALQLLASAPAAAPSSPTPAAKTPTASAAATPLKASGDVVAKPAQSPATPPRTVVDTPTPTATPTVSAALPVREETTAADEDDDSLV